MADQDKPLQFIKGGKIQTGRIAQQLTTPVAAPETEPQEQPIVPTVLPSQAPIWRDANGNLSYNQPDSYNWFSSFVDRRLYAQTGGGAGYWIGGRTPTRIFYEWSIGDFQGSERDQNWINDTTNPTFVSNWANTLRSQIGLSEQILIEDYGQTVLEDMIKTSVSSNNLSAKLAFALDAAESKRRIEAYDATTSWGRYIGTKTLSAVGNYMAVDPVTTTTTIASLGTGTLLPAAARSTFIASRLPWLTTPLQASRHGLPLMLPHLPEQTLLLMQLMVLYQDMHSISDITKISAFLEIHLSWIPILLMILPLVERLVCLVDGWDII